MGIGFAESMDSGRRGMARERARAAKEKAGEGELGRDGASAPVPSSLSAWAAGARLVDGCSAMVVCFFSVHVIETHVYFIFFPEVFFPAPDLGFGSIFNLPVHSDVSPINFPARPLTCLSFAHYSPASCTRCAHQMATYPPVLLGSVNTIPDDSAVSDLPRGQVDYLSHEWREEDVWRSWRNMTRLKNEIANGVRLENASWRTWWKQRNGLKTITPETLNWFVPVFFASLSSRSRPSSSSLFVPSPRLTFPIRLKDSDVTWLYGPLHTADPTPKPTPTATAALDLSTSPSPPLPGIVRKPILKHRSICELLTSDFPLSPVFSPLDSEEEDAPQIMSDGTDPGSPHKSLRPALLHTKSDTHITRWGATRAFRRDSPPRMAPSVPADPPVLLQSESPPSSVVPGQKRKHISFNTFVEQYIAIDKPKKKRPHFSTSNPHLANFDDDGSASSPISLPPHSSIFSYDEDSEDGIIEEADEILFDDDHDTHHPESPYPQISHPHPPHHSPPPHNVSPPSSSTSEEEDEDDVLEMRVRHAASTISRSPTHSSSSSTSSSHSRPPKARSASYTPAGRRGHNGFIMRSPSTDKELVTIALIAPTILKTKMDDDDDSPYPLAHLPCRPRDHGNASPVELVYVPPSYVYSATEESEDMVEEALPYEASLTDRPQPLDRPLTASPPSVTAVEQTQLPPAADPKTTRMPRDAGASIDQSPAGPEVIVSEPDIPRSRSRSRSRSMSRSRTPSPNEMIASTNPASSSSASLVSRPNAPAQATGTIYLAPSDPAPSRGRSASSSQVPSQPRGRSITRTSSFSDRESISAGSPDANVGLGIGSVGVRDRERDARGEKEGRRSMERGRDRGKRRSGSQSGSGSNSSLSPESPHAVSRVVVEQSQPEQSPVPEVRKKSMSVSSGSSSVTVVPTTTPRSPPRLVLDAKPITQTSYTEAPSISIPISPSCAQEEQEFISRQPTPANSPVLAMCSPSFPIARHERKHSSGSSRSPTRNGDDGQQGTLVGRAVEIMSNAGAFLGSFWHSGTPAGVPAS